jgi:16S rRNA (uracil1498-N3)-methyltransferase
MRLKTGGGLRLFNGRDGEWHAKLTEIGRKQVCLLVQEQSRSQTRCPDIELAFAPVKRARSEFIAEKATELGVRTIQVVRTRFTNQKSVRLDRLQAISLEAAEQTERMDLPEILPEVPLSNWLAALCPDRVLLFCDERATDAEAILPALQKVQSSAFSVLIGPEGGFREDEQTQIRAMPGALPVSLGPRILRADTAAVAALSILQAVQGDW